MKNLFTDKFRFEVLNVTNDKILIFSPLKKEVCEELHNELKRYLLFPKVSGKRSDCDAELYRNNFLKFSDIIAIGSTQMETRLANSYIEMIVTKFNEAPRRMYKCFVNKDWKNPQNKLNLPYHDDGGCSWNCLMQKLKNPVYGLIFNIDSNDNVKINHFKLNLND